MHLLSLAGRVTLGAIATALLATAFTPSALAVSATTLPATLAGVALGSDAALVLAAHPDAERGTTADARWWRWNRPAGGNVTITADEGGQINRIYFEVDRSSGGSVDLPCVGTYPFRDSDADLNRALNATPCSAFNGAAYGFPGGSIVAMRFGDVRTNERLEATWYRDSYTSSPAVGQIREIVNALLPLLDSVGGAARIYYTAECSRDDATGLEIPFAALDTAAGYAGTEAVHRILRDDPDVSVVRDRSGMLRIYFGVVSEELLQSTLGRINLPPHTQPDGGSAVRSVENAALASAERLGLPFGLAPTPLKVTVRSRVPDGPTPAISFTNITLDEALDRIARTFKSIVTYGACVSADGQNLINIDIYPASYLKY